MTYPGPLTPTQPMVERPDSVTHWSCPVLTEKFGTEGTNLTHNLNASSRCKYCHRTAEDLRKVQAEILAKTKSVRAANGHPITVDALMRALDRAIEETTP